jgi:hypothetical protein
MATPQELDTPAAISGGGATSGGVVDLAGVWAADRLAQAAAAARMAEQLAVGDRAPPEPPTHECVVCIGDLHGNLHKCTWLWTALEAELGVAGDTFARALPSLNPTPRQRGVPLRPENSSEIHTELRRLAFFSPPCLRSRVDWEVCDAMMERMREGRRRKREEGGGGGRGRAATGHLSAAMPPEGGILGIIAREFFHTSADRGRPSFFGFFLCFF